MPLPRVQLPAKSKERRRSSLGPRAKADALRNISNTAEKKKREKQSHPRKSLSKRCAQRLPACLGPARMKPRAAPPLAAAAAVSLRRAGGRAA
jgi:hypothetical protein